MFQFLETQLAAEMSIMSNVLDLPAGHVHLSVSIAICSDTDDVPFVAFFQCILFSHENGVIIGDGDSLSTAVDDCKSKLSEVIVKETTQ